MSDQRANSGTSTVGQVEAHGDMMTSRDLDPPGPGAILCLYSFPEDGPPAYLWRDQTRPSDADGGTDLGNERLRIASDLPGSLPFEPGKSACQIVWGSERVASSGVGISAPWVEASRACLVLIAPERRSNQSPGDGVLPGGLSILVIVVGLRQVEKHRFRVIPGERWLQAASREEVQIDPVDPEDLSAWEQLDLGPTRSDSARIILSAPSLVQERRLDLIRRAGDSPVYTPEQLYLAFAGFWSGQGEIGRPILELDYRFSYPRSLWGSSVPYRSKFRSVSTNLRLVYRLAGGSLDEFSAEFRMEARPSGGTQGQRVTIPENRCASLGNRSQLLELNACPKSGASRFVLRSELGPGSEGRVSSRLFWPIVDRSHASPDPWTSSVPVSLCLAVDAATAALAWSHVAPVVERLLKLDRLRRLQILWSFPDRPHQTRGWSAQQLRSMKGPFVCESPGADSQDSMICRGLSEALRESLLPGSMSEAVVSPAVGVVIVDCDHDPGRDRVFQTVDSRWAWFVRMRRSLGVSLSLLGYQLDRRSSQPDARLRASLAHLVILGRQASSSETPLSRLEEGQLGDPEAVEAEVDAILSIVDRMESRGRSTDDAGPGPPMTLRVVDVEILEGPRSGPRDS